LRGYDDDKAAVLQSFFADDQAALPAMNMVIAVGSQLDMVEIAGKPFPVEEPVSVVERGNYTGAVVLVLMTPF
jgi:hypothetical protein